MSLFSKKPKAVACIIGRYDDRYRGTLAADLEEAYLPRARQLVSQYYGNLRTGVHFVDIENQAYVAKNSLSAVEEIRHDGAQLHTGSYEKQDMCQKMQNFLAVSYSNDLEKKPVVVVETDGRFAGLFAILVRLY